MNSEELDNQIQTYEGYLLAKDKEQYLESLVPDSEIETFLKITYEFGYKKGDMSP